MATIIAVDHGNSKIKTEHYEFTSGVQEYPAPPPLQAEYIMYGGTYWALTEKRIPYNMDKTRDDQFFILTLFAIGMELQHAGLVQPNQDVILAVGLPPEHYSNLKKKFADYFTRGSVTFSYGNIEYNIRISKVMVFPQAYAAVVQKASELKTMALCYVVDIGGFTTDVMLFEESKPDLHVCRSLEYGVIDMCNIITGHINTKYGFQLAEKQIIAAIQGKPNKALSPDVQKEIQDEAQRYIKMIIDSLREHKVELKATPAIFVGGGSILFKDYISQSPMIASADFEPNPKANAIGYKLLSGSIINSSM